VFKRGDLVAVQAKRFTPRRSATEPTFIETDDVWITCNYVDSSNGIDRVSHAGHLIVLPKGYEIRNAQTKLQQSMFNN
jgi:hypothetical protein